jgi:hypothetical protein
VLPWTAACAGVTDNDASATTKTLVMLAQASIQGPMAVALFVDTALRRRDGGGVGTGLCHRDGGVDLGLRRCDCGVYVWLLGGMVGTAAGCAPMPTGISVSRSS